MPRLSVRRPTPATMVALAALFVALGGSSYAAITLDGEDIKNRSISGTKLKANTVRSSEVANGTLTQNDFKAAALPVEPLWAVVKDDGSLFSSKGVVSASKLCPTCRQYDITFNKDVSKCAAVATIGGNPSFAFQERGEIQTFTQAPPNQNQVRVIHHDSGGGSASDGVNFHLAVLC